MNKLIAFTGLAGSGKNTAADLLVAKHRYVEESFARRPKEGVAKMFGLSPEQVFGNKEQKEVPIPYLSSKKPVSPRLILQTMCTEWGRDMIDPDIWVYPVANTWNLMKTVPGFAGMVITDLRFDNEAQWVRDNGGIIINVVSNDDSLSDSTHVSESGIDPKFIDAHIINFKISKFTFHQELEHLLNDLWREANEPKILEEKAEGQSTSRPTLTELITEWADSVFPNRTITNAIHKMVLEEIPEYLVDQSNTMELADIGILLYDIAYLAGIDLDRAIRQKMIINKGRKWRIDENTGLMNHYDEGPDAEKIKYSPDILSQYAEVQTAESEGGEA